MQDWNTDRLLLLLVLEEFELLDKEGLTYMAELMRELRRPLRQVPTSAMQALTKDKPWWMPGAGSPLSRIWTCSPWREAQSTTASALATRAGIKPSTLELLIDLLGNALRQFVDAPLRAPRVISAQLPQLPDIDIARVCYQLIENEGVQNEWEEYKTEAYELCKTFYRWNRRASQMRGVSLLARSLWREDFDGWLGDLQEARWELIDAGYSRWRVCLLTWGRVALLFWSLIQVKCQDLGV